MRTILALAISATAFQRPRAGHRRASPLNAAPQEATSPASRVRRGRRRQHGLRLGHRQVLWPRPNTRLCGHLAAGPRHLQESLEGGKMEEPARSGGRTMDIDKIYPLDAVSTPGMSRRRRRPTSATPAWMGTRSPKSRQIEGLRQDRLHDPLAGERAGGRNRSSRRREGLPRRQPASAYSLCRRGTAPPS